MAVIPKTRGGEHDSYPDLAAPIERVVTNENLRTVLNRNWRWLERQAEAPSSDRRSTGQILEDLGHYEESVRQAYTGRYPVELLQNGHDACEAAGKPGAVTFAVTDSALLVSNAGVAFTPERIESLTRLGSSEKARNQRRRQTIGYKGVGFTAVFEITDTPQIITEGIAFGLDRDRARRRIAKVLNHQPDSIPARLFPFELDPEDWQADRETVERMIGLGAVTVIRLPFSERWSNQQVCDHVRESIRPTTLLFLEHVNEIEITTPANSVGWRSHPGRHVSPGRLFSISSDTDPPQSWLLARGSARIPRATTQALDDRLWTEVREVDVAVAVPWRRGIDGDAQPMNIHVYFPTDDVLGRAVLVHGDFYVDQSRRHIEQHGPGGEISLAVARTAARLTAKIAREHANQGPKLLSCLAVKATQSGYGQLLSTLIDEELAGTPFVRPASGGRPRRPADIKMLPGSLDSKLQTQLLALTHPVGDLIQAGDDTGWAGRLLSQLDVPTLSWGLVADRIDGARHGGSYEEWLDQLARLLSRISTSGGDALASALRERPVLRDRRDRWRAPAALFVRRGDVAALPPGVADDEVGLVDRQRNRALIRTLVDRELSSANALDLVLDALASGQIGDSAKDSREVLDFFRAAWSRAPQAVTVRGEELGQVRVPVRSRHSRKTTWARADQVYFGRAWTGDLTIDLLYGRSTQAALLAPPTGGGLRRTDRGLLTALGVAERPRIEPFKINSWGLPASGRFGQWLRTPQVQEALKCPDHPQTGNTIEFSLLDQLGELIDVDDPRIASALARAVAYLPNPLGSPATIGCASPQHRGTRHRTRIPGPQEWLLRTTPWVPVANDPTGQSRRGLDRAWCDLPVGSYGPLLIPRARFPTPLARELGVTTPDRATPETVELALADLQSSSPILDAASAQVQETGAWLLTRLNRAARRHRDGRTAPPIPAIRNGVPAWATDPLLPDLPDVELLDDVAVLPKGRWDSLRRVYGLRRASDVVKVDVVTHGRTRLTKALTLERRAQILAMLVHAGADERQTAFRLSEQRLREVPVASIELRMTVTVSDAEVQLTRRNHLQRRYGARGQLIGADLFQTEPLLADSAPEVGAQLADYLDPPDAGATIAWLLVHGVSGTSGITESDVEEARHALGRHGRSRHRDERDLDDYMSDFSLDPNESSGSEDGDHATTDTDTGQSPDGGKTGAPKPTPQPPPLPALDLDGAESPAIHASAAADKSEDGDQAQSDKGRLRRGGSGIGGGSRVDMIHLRNEQQIWGSRGEHWAYQAESSRLRELGYPQEALEWRSKTHQTSPYDFKSVDDNGNPVFIEVKTTTGSDPSAPFPISRGELLFAFAHRDRYWIYRVTDIKSARPVITAYRDPLGELDAGYATLSMKDAYLRLPAET